MNSEDTHSRLLALENSSKRMEHAIESLSEAVHELVKQHIKSEHYHIQHHKDTERTVKRMEDIEHRFDIHERKINRLVNIGYGIWIVIGAILFFGGNYVVDGIVSLDQNIDVLERQVDQLKYEQDKGVKTSYMQCEGDKEKPDTMPVPKPAPDTVMTNKPGI